MRTKSKVSVELWFSSPSFAWYLSEDNFGNGIDASVPKGSFNDVGNIKLSYMSESEDIISTYWEHVPRFIIQLHDSPVTG